MRHLRTYAKEYYHHVAAFPRYLSQIHALCPEIKARQVLLENLIDQEQGEENHPALWSHFAEGLGVTQQDLQMRCTLEATHNLVEGYFNLTRKDYATGLGVLYAYERQTPEVSKTKIDGLKKHYAIADERTLKFFNVHMQADEWHTQEVTKLIEGLDSADQVKAKHGALEGAKLLWTFLESMMEVEKSSKMFTPHAY